MKPALATVEPMHGEWEGCYRLRVGDYQIVFRYQDGNIAVLTVGQRSDVYR